MINSFIYSFIYLIRFLCEIIITLAAVKYLMPEIRKICRMIAGTEEKAQQKEAPGHAAQPKKAVKPEAKQGYTAPAKKPVSQQYVAEKMKTTAERSTEEKPEADAKVISSSNVRYPWANPFGIYIIFRFSKDKTSLYEYPKHIPGLKSTATLKIEPCRQETIFACACSPI